MTTKDIAMYVLGAVVTFCFFTVLTLLIFKPMPQENKDVLYLAIGALIGFEGAVVQYFYGSSAGSAKKDETISNIAKDKGFYQSTYTESPK
jgi:hypothetical protein